MSDREPDTYFLIDGPSPFAPLAELIAFQKQCEAMLVEHPSHPQWLSELESVTKAIEDRKNGKT